jgi:hypothetical protein
MRAREITPNAPSVVTERVTFYEMHQEAMEYAEDAKRLLNEHVDDTILDELREIHSAIPEVGNVYYYLSVYVLPAAKILSLSEFSKGMLLVGIDGKYLTFMVDGKPKEYPSIGEYPRGDSNLFVYLFDSESGAKQLLAFLTLKYKDTDDWRMTVKTLR